MKPYRLFGLAVMAGIIFACTNDPQGADASLPDSFPGVETHRVGIEAALADLHSALEGIDTPTTRRGAARRIGTIRTVRAADVLPETRSEAAAGVEDLVYIVNFEDEQGYAILGADDRLAAVIAVVDEGSWSVAEFTNIVQGNYEEDEVPPVFVDVVDYVLAGTGIVSNEIFPITPPVLPPVTPPYPLESKQYGEWVTEQATPSNSLLPMKWNQGAPYNKYTPRIESQNCPVGCVAVALGQIITWNYFNVRQHLPRRIGDYTIDWNTVFTSVQTNIRGKRSFDSDEDSPQVQAVARLLREIGRAVSMDYSLDGSRSTIGAAHYFLWEIGYIASNIQTYSRDAVLSSINNGPVYVRAKSYNSLKNKWEGHAWVIDGFCKQKRIVEVYDLAGTTWLRTETEDRTLFHCNFGWTSPCDGYYYSSLFDLRKGPVLKDKLVDSSEEDTEIYNFDIDRHIIVYSGW